MAETEAGILIDELKPEYAAHSGKFLAEAEATQNMLFDQVAAE